MKYLGSKLAFDRGVDAGVREIVDRGLALDSPEAMAVMKRHFALIPKVAVGADALDAETPGLERDENVNPCKKIQQ